MVFSYAAKYLPLVRSSLSLSVIVPPCGQIPVGTVGSGFAHARINALACRGENIFVLEDCFV